MTLNCGEVGADLVIPHACYAPLLLLLLLFFGRLTPSRQTLDKRRLKYAFERLDHDNNGELDYEVRVCTVYP